LVNQELKDPSRAFFFEVGSEKRQVAAAVVKTTPVKEGVRYEIAPSQDLPRDARFAVGLDGSARGAQGELTAGPEWRQECRTMGPRKGERIDRCFGRPEDHCSHGPISIFFSNPLGDEPLKSFVHIAPDPQIEWDDVELQQNRTQALLFGKFKPGTGYA